MEPTIDNPSIVALIPARSGSERIKNKNIRPLAGHPLIAYTICAAKKAGIFADIILSSDDETYAAIGSHYGARVPFLRPAEFATSTSPDIEGVKYTLRRLAEQGSEFDCFSILRPTSPFRTPETICRAWKEFLDQPQIDSLRAVENCSQHPGKMWVLTKSGMKPLLEQPKEGPPFHSRQFAALPTIYVQNASLEIAWSKVVLEEHSISGQKLAPFFTKELEGSDLNAESDWDKVINLVKKDASILPEVDCLPFTKQAK